MRLSNCPSDEQLRDFTIGKSPQELHEAIDTHLDTCAQCESTLLELGEVSDLLMAAIKCPVPANEFANDTGYQRGLELVRNIGRECSQPSTASARDSETDKPRPRQLREYRLLEELGEGGMGTVYKALHTELEKIVALKVLPTERMQDERAVSRFKREMKAVGKVDHPNIVRATDAGEVDGTHFLVMEYVEGIDLAKLVKRVRPLPIADACELIRQAAVGLQHAHEHGLVHRDIKPSNLILAGTGHAKVLDLGLARLQGQNAPQDNLTSAHQMMGTVDYMAPEQFDDSHGVDIRADIYSLGCTLYKLLTGHAPYSGPGYSSVFEKMKGHIEAPLPSIVEKRSDVPSELAMIVERMLAKATDDRFGTPAEVAAALESFAAQHDLEALARSAMGETETDPRQLEPRSTSDITRQMTETFIPQQESFGPSPQKSKHRRQRRRLIAAVVLLFLPFCYFFGGTVIRFVTNQGLLVVEVDDQNVEIAIRQNGLVVQDKTTHREFQLKAVAGEIELYDKAGNVKLLTKKFTLTRGGKAYVTVTLRELAQPRPTEPRPGGKASGKRQLAGSGPWQPTPEQQAFFDAVAKLNPEQQIEAVRERLKFVNPGFDGKLQHKIENGRVVELRFITDQVTDISPVRALPDLERLYCNGSARGKGRLAVLSPLQGMPLTFLDCSFTRVADLSPLQGMPLTMLYCHHTHVADLSPLQGMPLTVLYCRSTHVADLSPLQGMKLTVLRCEGTRVADLSPLQGMPLTFLDCGGTRVADLSPLQGMPLTQLICVGTRVTDLSPLQGMPLTVLRCGSTRVADLSPLQGMKLTFLACNYMQVADLSPLQGMPLTFLDCSSTRVADLSPLQGMPLTQLICGGTRVTDLSPLQGMPLTVLRCEGTRVADLSPLQGMPLERMSYDVRLYHTADETLLKSPLPLRTLNDTPVAEFWKQIAARRQAAEEFVESAAKLPAEKQIAAVRSRLAELARKLDQNSKATLGTKVADETVTEARLFLSNHPHDLTPLMALEGLKKLTITGGADWLDLSPVNRLPLEALTCPEPMARKNAPVLAEIKTLKTINGRPAAEFWKSISTG